MTTATDKTGSAICLKKVSELLKDASGAPAVYHVANYQRGYRWTPQQVTQLLDDLREFRERNGSDEDAFYCLQPLVIKRTGPCLDVVDGQQRLTTILLILTFINQGYVENRRRALFSLSFETRSGFAEFLERPSAELAGKNVDFFHLYQATLAIQDWFARNPDVEIEPALLKQTKVIWFELPDADDPVRAFTRLNAGKIPLTNDELIRPSS